MAVVRNGDYWFFEWKIQGQKVRRSSGLKVTEATRDEVRAREEHVKASVLRELKGPEEPKPLTLQEAIERFYDEKWSRARSGEKSLANATRAAALLGKRRRLDEITSKDLAALKAALFAEGMKGSTVNRHLAAILAVLNCACRYWEILDRVPAVKREDESENARIRVISWDEERKILAACEELEDWSFRDLYLTLVDTGMRVGEALGMQYGRDIDLDRGAIVLTARRRKNKRPLGIPISKRVREVLERRYELGPQPFKEYTVNMPLRRLQRVLEAAGMIPEGDIVIHSLRHTFAARLLAEGVSIYDVSKLLGHASVKTTERNYGHLALETLRVSIGVLDNSVAARIG